MILVFFDAETSRLGDYAPVIQLAAVAVDDSDWRELGTFERKVKFWQADADPEALEKNHFDPEVWAREGKDPQQVIREFSRWLKPYSTVKFTSKKKGTDYWVAKLVGHNAANFDKSRLKEMAGDEWIGCDPRVLCTSQRAQWWAHENGIMLESYKQEDLCKYFGITIEGEAHDALVDVRANIALAKRLRDPRLPTQSTAASV